MVDWGKLGKQAVDLSKKAGKKGVESFNDWKTDEERIQRVHDRKEAKLNKKDQKTDEKKDKKDKKKYKPIFSKHIKYNELTGEFDLHRQLKGKFNKQDLISYELIQDESSVSKGGVSIGRAVVGNAVLGGAGMILGGVSGKKETNTIVKNIKVVLSLKGKHRNFEFREIPIYSGKGLKISDPTYKKYMDEARELLLILDQISNS